MGLFRNSVTRRFGFLGLLSDLALVGTAASKLAQRRSGGPAPRMSTGEAVLAGAAALRLFRRLRRRRKVRKAASLVRRTVAD